MEVDHLIFYIIYILFGLALVSKLFLAGGRPTKTIAWLLVIIFLPIAGMVFYMMLGINRRKDKFFRIKKTEQLRQYLERVNIFFGTIERAADHEYSEIRPHLKLLKLMLKSSGFLPYKGNQVSILRDGTATYHAIFEDLEKATQFINMQYYMWEDGLLAERLAELFHRKINAGVQVRIIYDGVGSRKLSRKYIRRLEEMGVKIHGFLPMQLKQIVTSFNYRNHRKIIVVDGRVAFTGGINVSDKYISGDPYLGTWHDMHLRLEGSIVKSLQAVFSMDWYFASQQDGLLNQSFFPDQPVRGNSTVQIVASGPDSDFSSIRHEYFTIINQAKDYVYITNPYVIPGSAILEALQTAALSGVDVRLLIPNKSDNVVVKWSIRSYFEDLLQAGVKIFLYTDGFLHSKTIVADDSIASIGTANLDIRSFEQNFEVNALIYDPKVADQLKKYFLEDCQVSVQLDKEQYMQRPWTNKIKEGVAKIFSPIL